MPDSFNPHRMDDAPQGWADAFAALPLEAPRGDRWPQVARQLERRIPHTRSTRRERRTNWLIGMASAAVLALAVWTPLSQRWQPADTTSATPVAATQAPGALGPAAPTTGVSREPVSTPATPVASTKLPPRADAAEPAVVRRATIGRTASAPRRQPAQPLRGARDVAAAAAVLTAVQDAATNASTTTTSTTATTTAAAQAGSDPLSPLQAQSAQLEALVAMARDDSVGSAGSALITSGLDERIATIDAALSQADVTSDQRVALWQERVQALQQLAGVESTERWLASQGALYDAALVSVY